MHDTEPLSHRQEHVTLVKIGVCAIVVIVLSSIGGYLASYQLAANYYAAIGAEMSEDDFFEYMENEQIKYQNAG